MRTLLLAFLLSSPALAAFCDVKNKSDGTVIYTYRAPACDQAKFGGPWGDSQQTVHVQDDVADAADQAAQAQAATAQAAAATQAATHINAIKNVDAIIDASTEDPTIKPILKALIKLVVLKLK